MDVFAALADPVRRSLLSELSQGSSRVVDLAAERPISRPAVSRHLRLLAEADLVAAEDRGRERHYSVRPEGLAPVADLVTRLSERAGCPVRSVGAGGPGHGGAPDGAGATYQADGM